MPKSMTSFRCQTARRIDSTPGPDVSLVCCRARGGPVANGQNDAGDQPCPDAPDPDVVYLESQTGSLYLEKPPEVERYRAMFNHLVAKALDPEVSVSLIAEAAAALT